METAVQITSIGAFVLLAAIAVLLVLLFRRTLKFHGDLLSSITAGHDIQAKTQMEVKALTTSVEKLRVSLEESVKF